MMKRILIIGATSAIAEATACLFAARGDRLYLLARNQERLESLCRDLEVRGAESVRFNQFDVNAVEYHQELMNKAILSMDGIDVVLITHGTLPDQKACEKDFELTLQELKTNAISTISMLTYLANYFEKQKHGTIAVISSVAGDRGRASNYIYGTAKGAINIFLQGLRHRLYKFGVRVLTIKPGFVDTPMTSEFKKGLLWVSKEKVAKDIVKAIGSKKKLVIYSPFFWRWIMLVIRVLPESIFRKLNL